ncbi:MAG: peptide chain release factor-like protein [Myxococcota bacterium]|nr:peptide chain release factor-like protein [Myxococcota bacterium]
MERTCTVETYRSGGPGGQHRNKRDTAVRLTHPPTGTVVTATERRSQSLNRELAFSRMAAALERLQIRRRRRVATRPTRGSVRRRLEAKKRKKKKKAGRSWKRED